MTEEERSIQVAREHGGERILTRHRIRREADLASLLARATNLLNEREDPHQMPYDGPMDLGRATLTLAAEVAALHYTHLRILHLLEDRLGGAL